MAPIFIKTGSYGLRRLPFWKSTMWNFAKPVQILPMEAGTYSTSSNVATAGSVKPFREIPAPKGLPIVGSLFQIPREANQQLAFLIRRCDEFFPIYRESAGVLDAVFLYDLDEIKKMLHNEAKYPRRLDFEYWKNYHTITGQPEGILTSNHENWHRMRKVVDKPMLRIKDVSGYADDVNEVLTDFLERLGDIRQTDGLVPDLETELFNWSLETIGKILYERRFGGLSDTRDPEMQEFINAVGSLFYSSARLLPFPVWVGKLFLRRSYNQLNRSWDVLFATARKCVDERLNEIAANEEKDGERMTGVLSHFVSEKSLSLDEIYSNLTALMTAAVDTTSTTMLWMLQELALHPEVQEKLFAEVTAVLSNGEIPTYQSLQQMPYVKAVAKETLRMYSVGGGLSRIMQEDTVLCGYEIPAKTNVFLQGGVLGRLPQYFEDPEDFRPERWLRESGDKINPFAFLSFGYGTRVCVGRRVAELEMHMLLSRLIRRFTIKPGFTERAVESVEMVLKPDRPIKIKLIDRK